MKKILLTLIASSSISLMGMEKQIIPITTPTHPAPQQPQPANQTEPFVCTARDCENCLERVVCGAFFAIIFTPFTCAKDTCCLPCDSTENKCYPRTKSLWNLTCPCGNK